MGQENSASGVGRRDLLKLGAMAGAAVAGTTLIGRGPAAAADSELTLKGKRIAISATGTDHFLTFKPTMRRSPK